jgi:hypothetical protein
MNEEVTISQGASSGLKFTLALLFVLVLVSIGINLFLLWQLVQLRQQAIETIDRIEPQLELAFDQTDARLAEFQRSTLTFDVEVDEVIPVQTNVPFNETIEIPVQVTIPIEEVFETTITLDAFGAKIPVPVVVPVQMEFPIDEVVTVTISRTIPLSTSVPLALAVPVQIDISNTELAPYLQELRQGLDMMENTVKETISGLR